MRRLAFWALAAMIPFVQISADDIISTPYAVGRKFTSRPDDNLCRLTVESLGNSELKLYDGRMNHNNGWFVLRSEVPAGATKGAIKWLIALHVPGACGSATLQIGFCGIGMAVWPNCHSYCYFWLFFD